MKAIPIWSSTLVFISALGSQACGAGGPGTSDSSTSGDGGSTSSSSGSVGSSSSSGTGGGTPVCTPDETMTCTCSPGGDAGTYPGTETCSAGGFYGPCICQSCPDHCAAVNMTGAQLLEGYELKDCGCVAGAPCMAVCTNECADPTTFSPASMCGVCLGSQKATGTKCSVKAELTECASDPACAPYLQCLMSCP